MKIVSLNIERLCREKKKDEDTKNKVVSEIISYIDGKVKDTNDIILLHNVPWKEGREYKECFEIFRKCLSQLDMTIDIPNYLDPECTHGYISCAVKRKNSGWKIKKKEQCICSQFAEGFLYADRMLELYNEGEDTHLLGVHVPSIFYNPYASIMWDDMIDTYKKLSLESFVIIGDMIDQCPEPVQKRKYEQLVSMGAVDVWKNREKEGSVEFPVEDNIKTRAADVLMSITAYWLMKDITIEDPIHCFKESPAVVVSL